MTIEQIAREARKLLSIFDTWGNVLVPNIPGRSETSAIERMQWIVDNAKEQGIGPDELQAEIDKLNMPVAAQPTAGQQP